MRFEDSNYERQRIPGDSMCPLCGSEPDKVGHNLSSLGYLSDDMGLECRNEDCGHVWPSGVPIGEYEGELAEDLWCDSCNKRYGLVHRVGLEDDDTLEIDMKCPNPECYHVWVFFRELDDADMVLTGYPQITGSTEEARDYGY